METLDPFAGRVTGVLLVGGQSRRMGRDKAQLPWEGSTLLAALGARLFAVFGGLRVVGGDRPISASEAGVPPALDAPGARRRYDWVPDRWPGAGPLGGLCSGLATLDTPEAFVAACDMPRLDPAVLRALYPAGGLVEDARILRSGGREHPLHGFYRVSCRERLESAFIAGVRSVHEALHGLTVTAVDLPPALAVAGEVSCYNVNTPQDLEALRRSAQ